MSLTESYWFSGVAARGSLGGGCDALRRGFRGCSHFRCMAYSCPSWELLLSQVQELTDTARRDRGALLDGLWNPKLPKLSLANGVLSLAGVVAEQATNARKPQVPAPRAPQLGHKP